MRAWRFAKRLGWTCLMAMSVGMPVSGQTLELPPRATDAPTGREVAAMVRTVELEAREDRIFTEIAKGNIPESFRTLMPVQVTRQLDGREYRVTFWATADYLGVGSEEDAFYAPLSPQTAQRVADLVGASLPTPFMVDAIWEAASTQLEPAPIPPSSEMTTVAVFEDHNRAVRSQLTALLSRPNGIMAGHKKDVVIAGALAEFPGKVAIYGWHEASAEPIQPLYTGHTDRWVDYSHGIRLVHREVSIDGVMHDLVDVLRDESLAALLSDEGVIAEPCYPTSAGAESDTGSLQTGSRP